MNHGLLLAWTLLASPADGAAPDAEAARFTPLRPPLLGLSIEIDRRAGRHRLVERPEGRPARVVDEGSLARCEARLLELLERRHGAGLPNVPFPTLGGAQFWGDEYVYCGWRIQQNVFSGHHRLLDPEDVRQAWGSWEACRVALERRCVETSLRPPGPHLVILLHGLMRSRHSLDDLETALSKGGFEVASINYPSTQRSIRAHADQIARILSRRTDVRKVSIVTHSLGALVARDLLGREGDGERRPSIGRLVMIGPPNRGSVVAELLRDWYPYRFLTGEVGEELTPEVAARLPVPTCPFGIIAGGTGTRRGLNPLLPGDNDGTVLVANTRLPGADDFLLVRGLHSWLPDQAEVVAATVRFVEAGRFSASPPVRRRD